MPKFELPRENMRAAVQEEELREKVDLDGSRAVTHPRPRSLPVGVTNCSDIPFEVVHRVVVEYFGSPEKGLCLPPGTQPEHLLHLRRRDRDRAIYLDGHRFEDCSRDATSLGGKHLSDIVRNVDGNVHSKIGDWGSGVFRNVRMPVWRVRRLARCHSLAKSQAKLLQSLKDGSAKGNRTLI